MQQNPFHRNFPLAHIIAELGQPISQNLQLTGHDLKGLADACFDMDNLRFLYHFFRLINEYARRIENPEPQDPNFSRCCQFCRAAGVIAQQTLPITATTFENAPREYLGLSTKKEIVEFIDNGYTTTDRLEELQD